MSRSIYKDAIKVFGESKQIDQAIEELAELQLILSKYKRFKSKFNKKEMFNMNNILSEIVDVKIMLDQLVLLFDFKRERINKMKEVKLTKLKGYIKNGKC